MDPRAKGVPSPVEKTEIGFLFCRYPSSRPSSPDLIPNLPAPDVPSLSQTAIRQLALPVYHNFLWVLTLIIQTDPASRVTALGNINAWNSHSSMKE